MSSSVQPAVSSAPFQACAAIVQELPAALQALSEAAAVLQLTPLADREWYAGLTRKLVPQMTGEPFLVAAVVGGTNIGKSVVFNHLAGGHVSASSPLASGTKHPVCLIPPGFEGRHDLSRVFQGFHLHPWEEADAPLKFDEQHQLYWRTSPLLPPNLIVLDTPDIDSDAQVNWHRADCVRHAADVLVAILTQQKYNDAAVKQFFRKVAADDKAVVIVFNQCLLPDDEAYWPLWLRTFTAETGVEPDLVYVTPNDRRAAEALRLPFYQRSWPLPEGQAAAASTEADETAHVLRDDLTQLHFGRIKLRTLRGTLHSLLDNERGMPSYLREATQRSVDFRSAAELLSTKSLARIPDWPTASNQLLVQEIRHWWRHQRQGWTRSVHDFYNSVGDTVWKGIKWARQRFSGPDVDPWQQYAQSERRVILSTLENIFLGLQQFAELGNDLLRPRLTRLLAGETRSRLVEQVELAHQQVDFAAELQTVVAEQMQVFQKDSPQLFAFLKQLDHLAAAARPVTSVVLFFAGGGPLGDAFAPVAHDAAMQVVLHLAGGTGAVLAGETVVTGTGSTLRSIEAHFRRLHGTFAQHRAAWLAELLKQHLLGDLQQELDFAARLPESAEYQRVARLVGDLRQAVAQFESAAN